jgi:hypothetical protein
VTQREPVGKGLALELCVRAVFVTLQESGEALWRIPAVEGVAQVVRTAQVAEPDTAPGGELPQEWTPIRGEGRRNTVRAIRPPVLGVQHGFRRRREPAAVALGLLQRCRHIHILGVWLPPPPWGSVRRTACSQPVRCAWAIRQWQGFYFSRGERLASRPGSRSPRSSRPAEVADRSACASPPHRGVPPRLRCSPRRRTQ